MTWHALVPCHRTYHSGDSMELWSCFAGEFFSYDLVNSILVLSASVDGLKREQSCHDSLNKIFMVSSPWWVGWMHLLSKIYGWWRCDSVSKSWIFESHSIVMGPSLVFRALCLKDIFCSSKNCLILKNLPWWRTWIS